MNDWDDVAFKIFRTIERVYVANRSELSDIGHNFELLPHSVVASSNLPEHPPYFGGLPYDKLSFLYETTGNFIQVFESFKKGTAREPLCSGSSTSEYPGIAFIVDPYLTYIFPALICAESFCDSLRKDMRELLDLERTDVRRSTLFIADLERYSLREASENSVMEVVARIYEEIPTVSRSNAIQFATCAIHFSELLTELRRCLGIIVEESKDDALTASAVTSWLLQLMQIIGAILHLYPQMSHSTYCLMDDTIA